MPVRFTPVALALFGLSGFSAAAGAEAPPLPAADSQQSEDAAVITARELKARKGRQLEATGEVELRQGGQLIAADRLLYEQDSKDVHASGAVRIEQGGSVVRGESLQLNLESQIGELVQPQFELRENDSRGAAEMLHLTGKAQYSFDLVTYTTCPAGNDDWLLRMSRLDLDRTAQVGVAHHARVEFMGVPILYTPWMDFALNDSRRSGFMGPTFGSTNKGGTEFMLPYYWNIAPNYDATLAPRWISKRGFQFNNEFRYLQPSFGGEMHYDILPGDRESKLDRARLALNHRQQLGAGVGMALNLNRVSDDAYFRDLAGSVSGTSQTNLLREGILSYGGAGWTASARVQRYQTLQDPLAPVLEPYRRQPQLTLTGEGEAADVSASFAGEYVDFRHDTQVNGQRLVLYPSVSYPLANAPGYYLTPKAGVHHTRYLLGENNVAELPDATRTVPIFSLDSGMVFERADTLSGNDYVQTLEPRLYYVYVPYRKQDLLPNFDSAQAPFNFGQIFTENRFFGSDRVGDANMATLALTSRFIDNAGGIERLRIAVGQRFSFDEPRVNLVAPTEVTGRSDILLSLGGRVSDAWSLDSLFQYNPNQSHTESYNVMARFKPEAGKLLNLGYRFTRNTLRQADVSGQWPLFGRWHSVARLNYSLQDRRTLEALAGVEYNQACWAARIVAQSFTTATRERSTGFFLQLELSDLVRIGSDPLEALRASVAGYTKPNPPAAAPELQ